MAFCGLVCSLFVHLLYPLCLPSYLPMYSEGPSVTWHVPCLCISFTLSAWCTACLCSQKDPLWPGMLPVCSFPAFPSACHTTCLCSQKDPLWLSMPPVCASLSPCLPGVLPAYALRRTLCGWAFSLSVHLMLPLCQLSSLHVFCEATGSFCKAVLVFLPSACHLTSQF